MLRDCRGSEVRKHRAWHCGLMLQREAGASNRNMPPTASWTAPVRPNESSCVSSEVNGLHPSHPPPQAFSSCYPSCKLVPTHWALPSVWVLSSHMCSRAGKQPCCTYAPHPSMKNTTAWCSRVLHGGLLVGMGLLLIRYRYPAHPPQPGLCVDGR